MQLKAFIKQLILVITIGSALLWYEMFLYIYWSSTLVDLFFTPPQSNFEIVQDISLLFAIGFIAKPIGGVIFGYIGDKFGRKWSFTWSLLIMSLPSLLIVFLPTYSQIGIKATYLLFIIRFFQGLPAGGELPSAMCYLTESASNSNRKLLGSFTFVGCQLGAIVSILECLFLEKVFSHESLVNYGWKISFALGSVIAFMGLYFRFKMHESPFFENIKREHRISFKLILITGLHWYKSLIVGFCVSLLEVVGYFMISVFSAIYLSTVFHITPDKNLYLIVIILTLSLICIPFFGYLGDKFKSKNLLISSSLGIILLSVPFHYAISSLSLVYTTILQIIFILLLTVQIALLPSLLTDLFPTSIRCTGIGLSFNLCDGIVGGLVPIGALYAINFMKSTTAFIYLVAFAGVFTLITLLFMKKNGHFFD